MPVASASAQGKDKDGKSIGKRGKKDKRWIKRAFAFHTQEKRKRDHRKSKGKNKNTAMTKNTPRLLDASLLIKTVGTDQEKAIDCEHRIIERKNEKHLRAEKQGKKDINSCICAVKKTAAVEKKECTVRKIGVYAPNRIF